MTYFEIAIEVGKLVTPVLAIVAGIWAFRKWRVRDEHFPRMCFEANVNFVGEKDGMVVCELVVIFENKGVVPLRFSELTFVLRGIGKSDPLELGGPDIRQQLNFSRVLGRGRFIPKDWVESFIYPGVRTEYNFVTMVPSDTAFLRMQADFIYPDMKEGSHHAAKVVAVPVLSESPAS